MLVNDSLGFVKGVMNTPIGCDSSRPLAYIGENESEDLEGLIDEIRKEFAEFQANIANNVYEAPNLNLSSLTISQNHDLNVALKNALDYAKKVSQSGDKGYEVPKLRIAGLSSDQEGKFNDYLREEIGKRPPGDDEMGIFGATFVIVAGAIIGWALSDDDFGSADEFDDILKDPRFRLDKNPDFPITKPKNPKKPIVPLDPRLRLDKRDSPDLTGKKPKKGKKPIIPLDPRLKVLQKAITKNPATEDPVIDPLRPVKPIVKPENPGAPLEPKLNLGYSTGSSSSKKVLTEQSNQPLPLKFR
ncbi:MAG: hypothetical protein ACPGJV_14940 [Bacteriovoracaceae bacterium]